MPSTCSVMSTFGSSLGNFKQSCSTMASSWNTSDWTNAPKRALLSPMDHPLQFVAIVSFATFATIPVVSFVCFFVGTLIATAVAGIAWQVLMVVLGAIGLAVALSVAACASLCCAGTAACIYVAWQMFWSSLTWAKRTSTTVFCCGENRTEAGLDSQPTDKED